MSSPSDSKWSNDLSDERIAKIWAAVAQRLKDTKPRRGAARRRSPLLWGMAAASAALVVTVLVWLALPGGQEPRFSALASEADPLHLTLDEGSKLNVEPRSLVRVESANDASVSLELERGTITCDVTKKPARRFSVHAGDFEVRVVGTLFQVRRDVDAQGSRVDVIVERGVVEVRRRGQEDKVYVVRAGQRWSSHEGISLPALPGGDEPTRAPEQRSAPEPKEEAGQPAEEPSSRGESRRTPLKPDFFEEAREERRRGHPERAVQLYERFLSERPEDPRVGLAAFEIARLQMDALGQPRRALSSLDRAERLTSGGRFLEDIWARRANAHALLGEGEACRAQRNRYLATFRSGVHRARVEALCP